MPRPWSRSCRTASATGSPPPGIKDVGNKSWGTSRDGSCPKIESPGRLHEVVEVSAPDAFHKGLPLASGVSQGRTIGVLRVANYHHVVSRRYPDAVAGVATSRDAPG